MSNTEYEAVIGLEVHCQLLTNSKAFSPDSAKFGAAPNQHVDAVSLGHPGTLPVLNSMVVEYAVRLGLATRCRIAPRSVLARKHYFYADLPKGYQISQFESPICADGCLHLPSGQRVGITRIHIEEDAGKSIHDQDPGATLVDFNRCGVPLVELVTEPDLRSGSDAALFLQSMRRLVRYLQISDGNMEEGSLRCDANVSIRHRGTRALGVKTEIKNMNSFRHVERAIDHEVARQTDRLSTGTRVLQETRLWSADQGVTQSMRSKEDAHDYRYMPDPDLPPVVVSRSTRERIEAQMPELPWERRARYVHQFGLPSYDAGVLTDERPVADYFESTLDALRVRHPDGSLAAQAKAVSNVVMGDVLRVGKSVDLAALSVTPDRLAELVQLRLDSRVNSTAAASLFETMLTDSRAPSVIAEEHNLMQVSDADSVRPVVESVLAQHPKQVEQYLKGKKTLVGFFVGQVMRRFDGSPDPKLVHSLLIESLEHKQT